MRNADPALHVRSRVLLRRLRSVDRSLLHKRELEPRFDRFLPRRTSALPGRWLALRRRRIMPDDDARRWVLVLRDARDVHVRAGVLLRNLSAVDRGVLSES